MTNAGQVMGTPQYMAPEQMQRPAEVGHRADIYSLGVVFYQMLTGELPTGRFVAPSKKVQIDVRLDEVVLRALQREPERRYQQAGEIKTRVETIATTPQGPSPTGTASGTQAGALLGKPAVAHEILRQVRGPAIGLLATGVLNWVLLVIFAIVNILAGAYRSAASQPRSFHPTIEP